jgi:hypothetical protein
MRLNLMWRWLHVLRMGGETWVHVWAISAWRTWHRNVGRIGTVDRDTGVGVTRGRYQGWIVRRPWRRAAIVLREWLTALEIWWRLEGALDLYALASTYVLEISEVKPRDTAF